MNILDKIKAVAKDNDTINVIVEIQKGSKNKYEFDKETGLIKLDRVMYTGQDYPFDYGFIPNTLWHDGDPIDVVLLTTYPLMPGILVEARPIAMFDMVDDGESDVKILAVPASDPRWKNTTKLDEVNTHTIKEIEHFFTSYKALQNKVCTIEGIYDKDKAWEAIHESIELFEKKK